MGEMGGLADWISVARKLFMAGNQFCKIHDILITVNNVVCSGHSL